MAWGRWASDRHHLTETQGSRGGLGTHRGPLAATGQVRMVLDQGLTLNDSREAPAVTGRAREASLVAGRMDICSAVVVRIDEVSSTFFGGLH